MSHTPGPWIVKDWGPLDGLAHHLYLIRGNERICAMDSNLPHSVTTANARLIAAAPELLAWLTKAAQMADQQHRGGEDAPLASAWRWLAENAQLAIAKATGQEG